MSISTTFKYSIFCETENKYVTFWTIEPPLSCPNNCTHIINKSNISIIDKTSSQNVNIVQLQPEFTNGFYKTEGFSFTIPANSTAYKDVSWPYNTSIMTMNLQPSTDNIGDTINAYAGPDTIIGINTQTLGQNVSVINVNNTVLQNIKLGYTVSVVNNSQNIIMGECISIDTVNSRITCSIIASESIAPGAYIKVSRPVIKNFTFVTNSIINLANKNVSSTSLPANTVARMVYKNNSNFEKTFTYNSEYSY